MKKRIFAIILAIMMVISVFGCNNPNGSGTGNETAVRPVTQDNTHYVEGTLHKVNVTESSRAFVVNGSSDYKIVYTGDELASKAASFISRKINEATGVTLPVGAASEVTWSNDQKLIILNDKATFAAAGLTMPTDDLGLAGYYIKSVGNSVFIMTPDEFGCQYAAIAFLRHVVGFDVIASDMTIYEKTGETLPDMDIIEKPDIDMNLHSYLIDAETQYGMGVVDEYIIRINGNYVHNVFEILPKAQHEKNHPGWYSTDGTQLCYTARGNDTEMRAMQDEVVRVLKEAILANPTQRLISVTQEDVESECTCPACSELSETYGTVSASIIRFLNYVDDEIQTWIEDIELGRDITILFFAYHRSAAAPAKRNAEGEWEPIDATVVCNDTLGVYIAPIYTQYNRSLYHEDNTGDRNLIDAWTACAKKLYFWLYDTNFRNYMYPYETWDVIMENYRYMYSRGAIGARSQGQTNQGGASTAFHEFKKYILSKAPFDVNADYNEIVDKFFKYYFDDAEEPMRQMFDELRAYMAWLTETYDLPGTIYETIEVQKYWPKKLLDHWLDVIDEAYEKIEHYRDTDPEHYAVLERHIKIESLFPRYALIRLHSGSYTVETFKEMRRSFRDDITELGLTRNWEQGLFEDMFANWDI